MLEAWQDGRVWKDNRRVRCSTIDKLEDGHKLFDGVDFMMLDNLAQLVFGQCA